MAEIRAFVAIALPEEVRRHLREVSEKLKALQLDGRLANVDAIHLTLKFLGNVAEEEIPAIRDALSESVQGVSPFRFEVCRLGVFPHLANPRVLWVGITDNPPLQDLQQRVEKAFEKLGFEPEGRAFKPHLTLVRLKSKKNLPALIRCLRDEGPTVHCGTAPVEEVHLYQSILKPEGSEYRKLFTVTLGQN